MTPILRNASTRTREILEDLEAVRENLLALSDDIWMSIDHNDADALEAGVEFKRAYNAKAAAFDLVATEISALIQRYTSVRLEETEQSGAGDRAANERIVAELNRDEAHTLDEDFTYKRPYGFILDNQRTTGVTTWKRVLELVLHRLHERDPERFRGLCDHPEFTTSRGNPTFSTNPDRLRHSLKVSDEVFAECNLSANSIRDLIRRLLKNYSIPGDQMTVYLRQDRDAERADDAA